MISWVYGLDIWFFYFAVSADEIADFLRLFWAFILQELAVAVWVNIQESTYNRSKKLNNSAGKSVAGQNSNGLLSEQITSPLCRLLCLLTVLCVCVCVCVCINNCPTRCNTKQSIYYSASSLYMFQVSTTPIIRNTQNCNYSLRYCAATSLQRGLAALEGGSCTKIWPVPEAAVRVLCTPDDGCGWHPKHVEWTCRIINRLLCVASRWTFINIDQRCTEP